MDPVVENQFDDADELHPVQLIHGGEMKAREEMVPQYAVSHCESANQKQRDNASIISTETFPPEKLASNPDVLFRHGNSVSVIFGNSSVSDDSSVEHDGMSHADSSPGAFPFNIPEGVTRHDVLCGRGKGANNFIGNRNFRDLVMHYRERYWEFTCRADKRDVCYEIINTIHSRGGRFLVKNDGKDPSNSTEWMPIPLEKILVKVSQALREGASKWKKATKKFYEAKARMVDSRRTTPAMLLLAEISSRCRSA